MYIEISKGKIKYNEHRSISLLEKNTPKQSREEYRIPKSKHVVQVNNIYTRISSSDNKKYNKWRDQDMDVVVPSLVVCV